MPMDSQIVVSIVTAMFLLFGVTLAVVAHWSQGK